MVGLSAETLVGCVKGAKYRSGGWLRGGKPGDRTVDSAVVTTVSWVLGEVISVVFCASLEASVVSVLFTRVSEAVGLT